MLAASSAGAESLLDVYDIARDRAPDLQAAQSSRNATRELVPQARSALLPQVTANGEIARARRDERDTGDPNRPPTGTRNFTNESFGFDVRQPLFDAQALSARREASQQVDQAEAELEAVRQELRLRVAQAYFDVLAAEDTLRFAEAERAAIRRQLEEAEERFEVGLSDITALEEARARADLAEADVLTARNEVDNAHEALEEITGRSHQALYTLGDEFQASRPDPADMTEWEMIAADSSPALIATREASEAARERIQTQRAERYPDAELFARHQWSDNTGSGAFGQEVGDTQVGVQVSVPLYLGGGIGARTQEAQHLFDQARDELEGQRRQTLREVRDAYRATLTSARRIQALEQAVRSAGRSLEATEAGLEVGTRTMVDLLNAQRELFGARRDLASSRYEHLLATLRLKAAAGILDRSTLAEINALLEPAEPGEDS